MLTIKFVENFEFSVYHYSFLHSGLNLNQFSFRIIEKYGQGIWTKLSKIDQYKRFQLQVLKWQQINDQYCWNGAISYINIFNSTYVLIFFHCLRFFYFLPEQLPQKLAQASKNKHPGSSPFFALTNTNQVISQPHHWISKIYLSAIHLKVDTNGHCNHSHVR